MTIMCQSVEEFLENLAAVKAGTLYNSTVYFSTIRRPASGDRPVLRHAVAVHLSAVVVVDKEDNGYYILGGQECGLDYEDGDPGLAGSACAGKLKEAVRQFCQGRGWTVLPGVVGD